MSELAPRLDAHQHFWRYDAVEYSWISPAMSVLRRDFLPEDLEPELRAAGFDGCIAVQARQSDAETDELLAHAAQHEIVRGVVGWLDLRRADIRELLATAVDHEKLVGLRHIVQDEPDDEFLLRRDFCRGIEALGRTRLRYDILVYPRQLRATCAFVARFPELPFVLDHIAKPPFAEGEGDAMRAWADDIRDLAAASDKLVCKVSGLVTEADWHAWKPEDFASALAVVEEAFGRERLLYGSDWPVCLLAAEDYATVYDIVREWTSDWSDAERTGFFGANARAFYGL